MQNAAISRRGTGVHSINSLLPGQDFGTEPATNGPQRQYADVLVAIAAGHDGQVVNVQMPDLIESVRRRGLRGHLRLDGPAKDGNAYRSLLPAVSAKTHFSSPIIPSARKKSRKTEQEHTRTRKVVL